MRNACACVRRGFVSLCIGGAGGVYVYLFVCLFVYMCVYIPHNKSHPQNLSTSTSDINTNTNTSTTVPKLGMGLRLEIGDCMCMDADIWVRKFEVVRKKDGRMEGWENGDLGIWI